MYRIAKLFYIPNAQTDARQVKSSKKVILILTTGTHA